MFIMISWFYRPSLYCIKPLCNLNLFCSIWSIIVNVKFYLNLVICNKWLTTSKCFMLKIWICFIMSLVIKIFLKRKIWSFHVLEIRSFSTANGWGFILSVIKLVSTTFTILFGLIWEIHPITPLEISHCL